MLFLAGFLEHVQKGFLSNFLYVLSSMYHQEVRQREKTTISNVIPDMKQNLSLLQISSQLIISFTYPNNFDKNIQTLAWFGLATLTLTGNKMVAFGSNTNSFFGQYKQYFGSRGQIQHRQWHWFDFHLCNNDQVEQAQDGKEEGGRKSW